MVHMSQVLYDLASFDIDDRNGKEKYEFWFALKAFQIAARKNQHDPLQSMP